MSDLDPRVARFGQLEYRFRGGQLEWRVRGGATWIPDAFSPEDYAAVAALRDHPTEDM